MNAVVKSTQDWSRGVFAAWDRFWFTPAEPHTLALIRILAGAMLLYTHLVWSLGLTDFLGPNGWVTQASLDEFHRDRFEWSYLSYIESPALLWAQHIVVLVVMVMLTLGLWTRVTSVLAWFFTIMYCHRLTGALFGLDQINAMLAMYLMIGASGGAYSLDRLLAHRKAGGSAGPPRGAVSTNIALRLIQLHMCVIYLFGGIGKLRGDLWWDGSAAWFSVANFEYQSFDMTWLVHYPMLIALLTHVTVFWETFYCFLVWPKTTRPIVLFLAVCVHGGIAFFLGMVTFGLAMLIGNFAFVPAHVSRGVLAWLAGLFKPPGRAEQGSVESGRPHSNRESIRRRRSKPR